MFNSNLAGKIEEHLRLSVCDLKGVRQITACSRADLDIYRISFGYQRRHPLKNYLLMYDPLEKTVQLCADGGIGFPPPNVRKQLLDRLGKESYEQQGWTYRWNNIDLEKLMGEEQ